MSHKTMQLYLETLEPRQLPAAPIAPFDLDLLTAGDSGVSNSDNITNDDTATLELIAEKGATVTVSGAGALGVAVGQGDTLFFDAGDVVIEAERGALNGNIVVDNTQAGFQGTGYIEDTGATIANPENGGGSTYTFYIDTADTYYVHARVYYPNGSTNSLFVNIDDQWDAGENGPSLWSNTFNSWHMNTATTLANGGVTQSWALGVGWHTMEVHGREAGSLVDRIVVSTNAAAPADPGGAESVLYETYRYTFAAGDLIGTADGAVNNITATAENVDGTSPASTALALTLDNGTRTAAAPVLDNASDTGSSDSDRITSDTTATFTGLAGAVEGDATVWIRVGGADVRSATANADGSWSLTLQNGDLVVGANTVDIYYVDVAGNTSADSADITVTLDTAVADPGLPDLNAADDTGTANNDDITNEARPLISGGAGSVEANSTVQIWLDPPGGPDAQIGTATAAGDGSWSFYLTGANPLQEGANQIHIVAVDSAGNVSNPSADLTITLDTTATAPATAPDLDAASDLGTSNSDDITSDTTPTFTGPAASVDADATVWVRVDGVNVRSGTAAGDGSYSITLQAGDLTAGTHLVDIVYVDAAGNTSSGSPDLTVTLDTTAAAPAVAPDLASVSDTGSSNSDDLTNDTTATFTGSAGSVEGSSTVWVRVGGVDRRSGTANADGSWSIDLQSGDLAEGANAVDYYFIDPADNTSADSPDLTVTLDTTIPVPAAPDLDPNSDSGVSNNDNITADTRPTINQPAAAVEGDSTVQIWLDTPSGPDAQVGTATAAGDGSWSYTFTNAAPLEEGVNQIHIVVVDPAGNVSADSPDLAVTIDFSNGANLPPDLEAVSDTGAADDDNITADDTPTISGISPNNATIKVRVNGTTVFTFTDNGVDDADPMVGQWSYTITGGTLGEGVNTFDYLTIDTNNNASDWTLDLVVTLDTTTVQPSQADLSTADDSGTDSGDDVTNVTTPTLTGTAEANSTVTIDVNGGAHTDTAAVGANGMWSYAIPAGWLNEGANTIFAQSTDIAGNVSVAGPALTLTLDTTLNAPSMPDLTAATDTGSSNNDDITSHNNPRVVGTADPNVTLTVRLDPDGAATVLGTATADGAGNWNYTFTAGALSEGANVIDVVATDAAGNTADSPNLTITVETAINIPSVLNLADASDTGVSSTDDLTSLAAAAISGLADPNNTITVRVNGTDIGSTTSDGAGNWSYTFDGIDDLMEGTNLIDAWAADGSGNVSGFSADLVVTLDTSVATPSKPDLTTGSDTGASDTDNYTGAASPTIEGTSEPGATIRIHLNGDDNFDTVTDSDADGVWSYTFAGGLMGSSGGTANTIKVAQEDTAGNLSAFGPTLTLTWDDAATTPSTPDLAAAGDSGDLDNDDLTNLSAVTVTGTVESGSSLQIFVDSGGGPILIDTISESLIATGNWTYTFSMGQLSEGANLITVVATDKAGNVSASSAALTVTRDTLIAQPGTPDLDAGSDTGDSDTDNITSDVTPVFSGTADPDTHVTIRVDGEPINTFDADGAGNWSYTFALGEIQSGVHQIDVVAVDTAGNVSAPSDDLTIWLNVTPTQPAAPNLLAGSDTGRIISDDLTFDTTPTIDGKAEADIDIIVYLDAVQVDQVTADAQGFWNYTFSAGVLGEGDNEITIRTKDTSGLLSAFSLPLTVTLDTQPPDSLSPDLQASSDTGVSDSDNLTSDQTPTIEGQTEPSAQVSVYLEGDWLADLIASATGFWTYTFAPGVMQTGSNNVQVAIADLAGNISGLSAPLTITLDVQQDTPAAPVLNVEDDSGSSDSDNLTRNTTPTITGQVKPNSQVSVLVASQAVAAIAADGDGNWSYTFLEGQLAEGTNLIETISTDTVGNVARSAALTITLDTAGPIVFNYFPNGTYAKTTNVIELFVSGNDLDVFGTTDTSGFVLRGSGGDDSFEEGNEWFIPIGQVSVDLVAGLVQLQTVVTLTDDTYQLEIDPDVSLHDKAGNPGQLSVLTATEPSVAEAGMDETILLTFTIDTAGPPAPLMPELDVSSDSGMVGDQITNSTNPLIRVQTQPDSAVEVIANGRSAGFAQETTPGIYEIILDAGSLREGDNLILARVFDGLANSSDLSPLLTLVIDSQGPQVADVVVDPLWLNFGPTNISIVFAENDIDAATVASLTNFQLLAAGGDGSFDEGNETLISVVGASFVANTHTIDLALPQTVSGHSALTPDTYRLTISDQGQITDLAGNSLSESAQVQFAVVPAASIHDFETFSFTTDDNRPIFVDLLGKGDAQILLGGDIGSDNMIEKIVLTNTNENTRLRIRATGRDPITVGSIFADDALRAILGNKVEITEALATEVGITNVRIGAFQDDVTVDLVSTQNNNAGALRLKVGQIGQNVAMTIEGYLKELRTDQFISGSLTADAAERILIRAGDVGTAFTISEFDLGALVLGEGNFSGRLNVAGSIHKARFMGDVSDSIISAGHDIDKLIVGGDAVDNLFLAGSYLGADGQLDGIDDQFGDGRIGTLKVKGRYLGTVAAAATNPGDDLSYFTADDTAGSVGSIEKVQFGRHSLDQTAYDRTFGLAAAGPIAPIRILDQILRAPFELDDFQIIEHITS